MDGGDLVTGREERAHTVLDDWLLRHSTVPPRPTALTDWHVGTFREALLFSRGTRSNRLYFVRGDKVVAFSPSRERIDDAYARLTDS